MGHHVLPWAAVGFAFSGAMVWLVAAGVRLPANIPFGWDADDAAAAKLLSAMRCQGWLNAVAASLTALGALCQALSIVA